MAALFTALLFITAAVLIGRYGATAHWFALGFAFIGGVFLFNSPARSWWHGIASWASWTWWIAFFVMIIDLAVIGFDVIRDRRPDRPAMIAVALLPIVLVAGLAVLPKAGQEIGAQLGSWGNSVAAPANKSGR